MTRGALLVRCDATLGIGLGHLTRCLVLADAWNGPVMFAMRCGDTLGHDRIRRAGHGLELIDHDDPETLVGLAARIGAAWVALDHYELDERFVASVAAERHTLAIDDLGMHEFAVDVLVNQNPNAAELAYRTRLDTRRLLGTRYALVRDAYRRARPSQPRPACALESVLVCFGGSDPEDRTASVLAALAQVPRPPRIVAAVGAGYAGRARATHGIIVQRDLPDLVALMLDAQLMIGAGGSTAWEACCLGLPMVLQPFAENQRGVTSSLARLGAARDASGLDAAAVADLVAALDADAVAAMAAVAWAQVDGLGATRVVEAMT